jgi:hypothetical protein
MKMNNYGMKDGKIGHRTADIQNDVVLKLGSTISHGLSLPREIRMVAPVGVVKIGI